jgi:hypothetical protein
MADHFRVNNFRDYDPYRRHSLEVGNLRIYSDSLDDVDAAMDRRCLLDASD